MNKLLKELLPKEFKWVDLSTLSEKELLYLSTSFKNILISKEKRGNDLDIIPGWIQPINDCTDFKIISNQGGNEYLNIEINRKDILAIHLLTHYKWAV